MSEAIIQTRGFKKTYGMGEILINALDGVDIQVRAGEFVSKIGRAHV